MKLYFFGILFASRKHKSFVEVHGDVMTTDFEGARQAAVAYGLDMIQRSPTNTLFIVGTTLVEADSIRVGDYV